MTVHTDLG